MNFDNQNASNGHEKNITGEVSYWTLHHVGKSLKEGTCFELPKNALPILMTGLVENDYAGRFKSGVAMRSSFVTGLDMKDMILSTQNSTYKLMGPGLLSYKLPFHYDEAVGEAMLRLADSPHFDS